MERFLSASYLAIICLFLGSTFGTTPCHQKTVPPAKSISKTEMGKKNANRILAKTYASVGFGWGSDQWVCIESLWAAESRFDASAKNPRSTAFGIAQVLGESSRDPRIQILRGYKYISFRYGSPCKALRFHKQNGWY